MAHKGYTTTNPPAVGRQSKTSSGPVWHERHGSAEFKVWQKEHPAQNLTYDDWKRSRHVEGLSLYYAALHIWDESASSDEEVEQVKVEIRPRAVRAQSAREPKKSLKTNGNEVLRPAASATSLATAIIPDLSTSAKKKRKARKKYLSQELVASEESDHGETATPINEATTPSASIITVNGRRKSSNRKPRKKPISEEIISPDDEEDPMAMNGTANPAIASPLPVRSALRPPPTVQTSESHKKTILKLSTRKAPKKKALSEETILDDDTDEGTGPAATVPSTATAVTEPNITATTESHTPLAASSVAASKNATASPDPNSDSAAATRRGLRTRRPAQQRPYSYDAQIFEEHETDVQDEDVAVHQSPHVQSRRFSTISFGRGHSEDQPEELDEETLAILQGDVDPEPESNTGRPKHFKGKGRTWKKEESDEDLEFTVGKKKKAAKAKAIANAQGQQPRKRGRPRKTIMSEDVIRDDSDSEAQAKTEDVSLLPAASEAPAKRARKPPRKSALSEEVIRSDSDEDEHVGANSTILEASTPETKKRDHPSKSEQSTKSKMANAENEDVVSYTPKGTPNMSCILKGEPKQITLSIQDIEPKNINVDDDSELDDASRSPTLPGDIERHMASVNADDDDGEL